MNKSYSELSLKDTRSSFRCSFFPFGKARFVIVKNYKRYSSIKNFAAATAISRGVVPVVPPKVIPVESGRAATRAIVGVTGQK